MRTSLFNKRQPGGLTTVEDMSRSTGNRFYVDSGASNAKDTGGFGYTPDAPAATIDYLVDTDILTANNGDIIYAMPGHADTVSEAGGLAIDVAGVSIIGIGRGSAQPTITLDTADTATIAITVANTLFENIHFVANYQDIATAIILSTAADDCTFDGCRFTDLSATLNAKIWIQDGATTTSNRITIENCRAKAYGTANTHFLKLAGTGDGHIIRRNILMGDWDTMCIGGAGVVTDCSVIGNFILNVVDTADTCINMAATATGICADNRCGGGHTSDGIVCGDLVSAENYYEDHETDTSGVLEPAA